jgi:hypothetical protein
MNRIGQAVVATLALCSVGAAPSQSSPLDRVMRQKLVQMQKILEAVVTSDWVALETQSRELERLTTEPAWTSLKLPEYAKYSAAFIGAVHVLRQAAAQRDLDATPKAYAAVTLKCVECHRYLARARIAK